MAKTAKQSQLTHAERNGFVFGVVMAFRAEYPGGGLYNSDFTNMTIQTLTDLGWSKSQIIATLCNCRLYGFDREAITAYQKLGAVPK